MIVAAHAVLLDGRKVGTILQRGDVARFVFEENYWDDPTRHVLGLWFEDHPRESPQAALRLPHWFSNLLPEGPLRDWIAHDRGVSVDRELQLLLQIGKDLPGAVEVVSAESAETDAELIGVAQESFVPTASGSPWKFSLAGIGLKFSLLRHGDRLSMPAADELGDWIVKFPDAVYRDVPRNEFASMSLAREVGINCPNIELVDRDALPVLPDVMWPSGENLAYAIARFDRGPAGKRVHIEDLAQVRGFYPPEKYSGSFETVGALVYRGEDHQSLREFVRRLTFNFLIGNGDAHLKNWSLIYRDGRRAELSPAYDIVSTAGYYDQRSPDDIGLKFGSNRVLERVDRSNFARLQRLLNVQREDVLDVVDDVITKFRDAWDDAAKERFPLVAREWIETNFPRTAQRLSGTP